MNGTIAEFLATFTDWKTDHAELTEAENSGPTPHRTDSDTTALQLLAWAADLLTTAAKDQAVLDAIALNLGTHPEWNGAEELEWIDCTIATVRPQPGGSDPADYAHRFKEATGRSPKTD